MSDALNAALAAEEHRQGMRYGDDPSHCGQCATEVQRRLQAACEHDGDRVDITTVDSPRLRLLCQRCGTTIEEDW